MCCLQRAPNGFHQGLQVTCEPFLFFPARGLYYWTKQNTPFIKYFILGSNLSTSQVLKGPSSTNSYSYRCLHHSSSPLTGTLHSCTGRYQRRRAVVSGDLFSLVVHERKSPWERWTRTHTLDLTGLRQRGRDSKFNPR